MQLEALHGVMFYLAAYGIMNAAAFGVKRGERLADRPLDRQGDDLGGVAGRGEAGAARPVAHDQGRLGQLERVAHLLGLPPAVDEGRDRAGLERRHVDHDPGRAIAHRDRHPVALLYAPAAHQDMGEAARLGVQLREGQPLVAGDDRGRRGV